MAPQINKSRWYLVYTKPREENTGVKNLRNQGYEVFFPQIIFEESGTREENSKIEPMFPRYLFIKLNTEKDNWIPIRSTVGISHMVSFGNIFAKVPDQIVSFLRTKTDKNGIFRQKVSRSAFQKGDKIVIKKGILAGREAIFLSKKSKERVRVLLRLVNQLVSAEMPVSDVELKETTKTVRL